MKVGHENPVNATAARVMRGGVSYESGVQSGSTLYQGTPIAMRAPTSLELANPAFPDLRGFKFGRFTALGMAVDHPKRWVVRCACGIYSLRSAKAIRNPSNSMDCCNECRHLLFLKREEFWRRTGRDVTWADLA